MKKLLFVVLVGAVTAPPAWAQAVAPIAPAAPAPAAVPAQAAPARPGTVAPVPPAPATAPAPSQTNVRFDVTITDTGGPKPITKALSLTIMNGSNGSIRNTARQPRANPNPPIPTVKTTEQSADFLALNVDVRNVMTTGPNTVRAGITIEYQPYVPDAATQPGAIIASSSSNFVDGRRTQILVTSDPISDRKTTIEVTATILK